MREVRVDAANHCGRSVTHQFTDHCGGFALLQHVRSERVPERVEEELLSDLLFQVHES